MPYILIIISGLFLIHCSSNNYNQIKGIKIFGKFIKGKIRNLKVDQNAEIIYHMYNDEKKLIGVDKAVSSSISMKIAQDGIDEIIFNTSPEGMLYPENFLEENEKFLEGFVNREHEKISQIN